MRIIVLNLHYKQKTPKHIKAMALELVYLSALSGEKCSFYAVLVDHCAQTEFENFIQEHQAQFYSEVKEIIQRLHQMGKTTGALHPFFKKEGNRVYVQRYGHTVCALYDEERKFLRLYCVRLSEKTVILGGGGPKSKLIRRWQEDEHLSSHVHQMMLVGEILLLRLENNDVNLSPTGILSGDLTIH